MFFVHRAIGTKRESEDEWFLNSLSFFSAPTFQLVPLKGGDDDQDATRNSQRQTNLSRLQSTYTINTEASEDNFFKHRFKSDYSGVYEEEADGQYRDSYQ